MEIDLTTPALLFSAISLIMLAYTNRFMSYAQLVRALKEQYRANHSSVTAAQIANLRKRLYLTRAMQVTGTGSLLLCVVSMFFIYIQLYLVSIYIFGLAMVLLIISLAISVYEIYISVKALEIHLDDMDEQESHFLFVLCPAVKMNIFRFPFIFRKWILSRITDWNYVQGNNVFGQLEYFLYFFYPFFHRINS